MTNTVGTVLHLVGVAQARAEDGSVRTLSLGDVVFEGEVLLTGRGAVIEVAVEDAPSLVLPGNSELLLNAEVTQFGHNAVANSSIEERTLEDLVASLDDNGASALESVLEFGEGDILEQLEPATAGGAASSGHSFVRLGRIGYGLTLARNELLLEEDELPIFEGTPAIQAAPPAQPLNTDLQLIAGEFFISDVVVSEGTTALVTITRVGGETLTQSVDVRTIIGASDTAEADDFTGVSTTTVTFAPGITEVVIEVDTTPDNILEGPETLTAQLSNPTNGGVIVDPEGTITIVDDGTGPDPDGPEGPEAADDDNTSFAIDSVQVLEGGVLIFTVTRTGDAVDDQTIDFATSVEPGNTAEQNDFVANSGTLTFQQGVSSITVRVETISDGVDEPDETMTVTLSNPPSGSTITQPTGIGTILDNDLPPPPPVNVTIELSVDDSVVEAEGATLDHTISLVDGNGDAIALAAGETITLSLSYADIAGVDGVEGADLSTQLTTITLTGDGTTTSFALSNVVADDALAEGTEGYVVSLGDITNDGTSFDSLTISSTVNSAEGRIVDETNPPGSPEDPQDVAYVLEIFAVVDGAYVSANEIAETGGVGTYVVLAVDDSGNPLAAEDQPGGDVDVLVADDSATRTADYDTTATRTVTVGTTFTIDAVSDTEVEGDETFTLSLDAGTWTREDEFEAVEYQGGVTTTIVDDDVPPPPPVNVTIELSVDDSVVEAEGATLDHTISLVDGNGDAIALAAGETITLSLSYADIAGVDGVEGADLSTQRTTITLTGDGTTTSFALSNVVADDALAEGTEGYVVSLGDITNDGTSFDSLTISSTVNSAEGRIVDETNPPGSPEDPQDVAYVLEIFAVVDGAYVSANEIAETGGVGTYVVLAVDDSGNPLAAEDQPGGDVDVLVADDSATRTADYDTTATRTVTVGTTFTIDAVSDTEVEGDETFTLSLDAGTWTREDEFEAVVYQGGVTTTIVDDDVPPPPPVNVTIELSVDDSVVEAEGATLDHTISLVDGNGDAIALAAGETITLSLSYADIAGVDGVEGADLSTQLTTITLTGDGTTTSFALSNVVADDALAEGTEGYVVSLGDITNDGTSFDSLTISSTVNSAEGRIVDETNPPGSPEDPQDVAYVLEIFAVVDGAYVSANEIAETGGVGTYVVLAVDDSGNPLAAEDQPGGDVDVLVADDSATRTADYDTTATRTVTVGTTFTIDAVSDTEVEGDETFTLSLDAGTWTREDEFEAVEYQGGVTTTIVDDDVPPPPPVNVTIELSVDDSVVEAEGATLDHTISLVDGNGDAIALAAGETITLSLSYADIAGVDGVEGADLSTQRTTITLTGDGTTTSFALSNVVADDALAEGTEGYVVSLGDITNDGTSFDSLTISSTVNSAEGRIVDETNPPGSPEDPQDVAYVLEIFAVVDGAYVSANEIAETGGVGTYVVLAVDDSGNPLAAEDQPGGDVDVLVADDSATRTADYDTTATRTVTVGTTFTIDAVSDTEVEGDETFTLSLDAGTWTREDEFEAVEYQGGVTTTIVDDDVPPPPPVNVTIELSVDDSVVEAEGATLDHTISLVDGNGDAIALAAGETITLSLSYADIAGVDGVEGADLSTQRTTITLTGDGTTTSFALSNVVADDALAEGTEGYVVSLGDITNDGTSFDSLTISSTVNSAEGRIVDETNPPGSPEDPQDVAYVLEIFAVVDGAYVSANEIAETGGVGTYVVLAVDDSGNPLAAEDQPGGDVDVLVADDSATRTADYDTTATRTVTVGTTFTIDAVSDTEVEGDETFTLSLDAGTWTREDEFEAVEYQGGVTTTIVDDDVPPPPPVNVTIELSVDDSVVEAEGATLDHTISLVDGNGDAIALAAGETITLSLSYADIAGVDGVEGADLSTQLTTITLTGDGTTTSFALSNVVADDALAEGTEGYVVSLGDITNDGTSFDSLTISSTVNSAEGRIVDETNPPGSPEDPQDVAYVLEIFAVVDGAYVSANEIAETGGVGTYVVLAVDDSGNPLAAEDQPGGDVDVLVADDSATRTADYDTTATRTVTVGTTFTIDAVSDTEVEGDETFTLSLDAGTWTREDEFEAVEYQGGVTTTIVDDDSEVSRLPHATSHVTLKLENGDDVLIVKIDDYNNTAGDSLDPEDVEGYIASLEAQPELAGYTVTAWVNKAGTDYYDENGNNITASVTDGTHPWLPLKEGKGPNAGTFSEDGSGIDYTYTPGNLNYVVSPVAVDLDGDGIDYLPMDAGVVFTDEASGESVNTAWIGPEDGMLAIDADGSGTINQSKEYVFTEWSENADTDMEAIAEVFDTNQNGQLDPGDEAWDQFGVWQDADSDGVSDKGEFVPLSELGVDSIALTYNADSQAGTAANGDVTIHGQSTVTFNDGSTTIAEDTSFAIQAADVLSDEDELVLPGAESAGAVAQRAEGEAAPEANQPDLAMAEVDLMSNLLNDNGHDEPSGQ